MSKIILENPWATISQSQLANDIDVININHKLCQAKVSLYGGQVLSFIPKNQQDLFWLSETSAYEIGKAIRGGIPLCWPWFGANDKQSPESAKTSPAGNHGFARQVVWQLDNVEVTSEQVVIDIVFQGEKQHSMWPNAFQLKQTLCFGSHFEQILTMHNLSAQDAEYTSALHSYFNVSSPLFISIKELEQAAFFDKLSGKNKTKQPIAHCVGPIDRVYEFSKAVKLIDSKWQRSISIESNASQWVLWNPGEDIANSMADIHPKGEQNFVCLEAAQTTWQNLPAGKSAKLRQKITVQPLVNS
ncbi:D-hexose-6-phosphate mutarotase [Litorilituus lipolyticus]|uniref:Putative glucose-6-phosphate 1-epimerase n=1 Tax=Litorilituus lipolyticus TaxID=2491017 RepID=A0A502L1Y9_9GAMM|nr:D-hexose-6-phosphate mutarotase [Litorilituus lipolyticus]TPH16505.1 D-hexose-6-phosphate mutarotase [Litorilituus lipolyticus]